MQELITWIIAAEGVVQTCTNSSVFIEYIEIRKQKLNYDLIILIETDMWNENYKGDINETTP